MSGEQKKGKEFAYEDRETILEAEIVRLKEENEKLRQTLFHARNAIFTEGLARIKLRDVARECLKWFGSFYGELGEAPTEGLKLCMKLHEALGEEAKESTTR